MSVFNCKKCSIKFKTISLLRKHQWVQHRRNFDNPLSKNSTTKKLLTLTKSKKLATQVALERLQSVSDNNSKGVLTALELLDKLKTQQKFMNDVVSLISGLISHHTEDSK